MKKICLNVNTTNGRYTDFAGALPGEVAVVNGDTVLVCARFQELLGSTSSYMDLTGATALRCTVDLNRAEAATNLTIQTSYNGGFFPTFEDLTTGAVTWLVSFSSAAITTALGTSESITAWMEFSWLDASSYPQTLGQIPIIIYAQIDSGAEGTPPPTSPTYLTAAEIDAAYARQIADDTPTTTGTVTVCDGRKWVRASTAGGAFALTLESASTYSTCELLLMNTGTNVLTITPAAAGTTTETINDVAGNQTIATRYGMLHLKSDGTNWVSPIITVPA